MKTKKQLINLNSKKHFLIAVAGFILLYGCSKTHEPSLSSSPALNAQEQALLGSWQLTKSETYEITGQDYNGQYQGSLIGSSVCDSTCKVEFKNEFYGVLFAGEYKGHGTIGGCSSATTFVWQAKATGKLQTGNGITYDIDVLNADSMVISNYYTSDVLKLRSVLHYKR